VTFLLEHSN